MCVFWLWCSDVASQVRLVKRQGNTSAPAAAKWVTTCKRWTLAQAGMSWIWVEDLVLWRAGQGTSPQIPQTIEQLKDTSKLVSVVCPQKEFKNARSSLFLDLFLTDFVGTRNTYFWPMLELHNDLESFGGCGSFRMSQT